MKTRLLLWSAFIVLPLCSTGAAEPAGDPLWQAFQSPPAEARPFMRWWWNGNRVTEAQLLRELDQMKAAGVGGVEINPIELHEAAVPTGDPAHDWLSPEWNRLVRVAVDGARARGMVADLIVGSGWPFGGRFLTPEETIQGLVVSTKSIEGPQRITVDLAPMLQGNTDRFALPDAPKPELRFVHLAPLPASELDQVRDLTAQVTPELKLEFELPAGRHQLLVGAVQRGFRGVMHGAPGADGPVLDHFNAVAVRRFLDRMSGALAPYFGGKMGNGIRALFCDSLELSGANWTDDLPAEFKRRRGYALEPYLAFVADREKPSVAGGLRARLRRVREDYAQTQAELLNERFVGTFVAWCREQGVQSRYQAYGMPALYDMHGGYLLPDIPEGDMWIFNNWMGLDGIRYAFFNKYASSAGHQRGRRLIACEAMTNTRGVFRETPEYFKQAGDLNLMTGVNHNILHGWNYSPPEAGYPGWVRYGCYFKPDAPWWPEFREWMEYQARLCAVLQHSEPVAQVAILGPTADVWGRDGLERNAFISTPAYLHELWQAFSAAGVTADYIGEGLLAETSARDGQLVAGSMRYRLLIVVESDTLAPATVAAIERFAAAGGRIAFVGRAPVQASEGGAAADPRVAAPVQALLRNHPDRVAVVTSPKPKQPLLPWAGELVTRFDVPRSVTFDRPDERLFQIHHRAGAREVHFFANVHRDRTVEVRVRFAGGTRPWRWDAFTGARQPLPPPAADGTVTLRLAPLESLLLVRDPALPPDADAVSARPDPAAAPLADTVVALDGPWRVEFRPVEGESFQRDLPTLADLTTSGDPRLAAFSGVALYRTQFSAEARGPLALDLGRVHGTAEIRLNGKPLGSRWWGRRVFAVAADELKPGANELEVRVATSLFNLTRSLGDRPIARAWTTTDTPADPSGLLGPVRLARVAEAAR